MRALIAKTWSGIVKYMTPFWTSGVDLIVARRLLLPPGVARKTHDRPTELTVDALIFERVL